MQLQSEVAELRAFSCRLKELSQPPPPPPLIKQILQWPQENTRYDNLI